MQKAIEIDDLRKSFRQSAKGESKTVEAVRGVNLSVERGEIFGFLGPNGAGKTTCLRMLTTLLPIDSGEAHVASFDVRRQPKEVRRRIGYVGQMGGADMEATGWENLLLSGRLYGMTKRETESEARKLVELFELGELIGRMAKTYSGGQRRRLEIALGILHRPEVLFLDEPTTGLDPQNRANLWEHIRKLKNGGMTVFLTTHYLDEADELADRLCIMDKGVIVAEGTPAALKRQISGDVVAMKLKHAGDLERVKRQFSAQEAVLEARVEGDTLYLYVSDGAKTLPKLFTELEAAQVQAETVALSQPSLDDVFLKQTGRSLRDTGKEGS
ncbi:daunorubicin resistance protein DrrA family ABC transporter ATP-binding protein [Gorillibacterium massiliense]|uniref:daunorubicin resistance protein DrrA family ABC transporter ATP-binding protein n=1 Tax=Gorillibacterium massiliense TaxID=1280390 RepID=UPI0004B9D03B|nr:daunorubicin resistance protein DrrA family ABC transporter ATP-binding protein [Gorillibacterium massiliense]